MNLRDLNALRKLAIEMALRQGIRGLRKRSTLFRVLQKYRNVNPSS